MEDREMMFCKHCGEQIDARAIVCPFCGRQVGFLETNEINDNMTHNTYIQAKECDKWVTFLLFIFLGIIGVHKFYENKVFLGLLYIFTLGFFGIGLFFDFFIILLKPRKYYVR